MAVFVAIGAGALVVSDAGRGSGPPGNSTAAPATPSPSTMKPLDPGRREVFVPPVRRDRPAPRFPLSFWFGQPDAELFEGDRPLERYPTLGGGRAELWQAGTTSPPLSRVRHWLVFRLASWTVLAPASTPAMAAELVPGLDARETGDGSVVIVSPSGTYASTCLGRAAKGVAVFAGIDGDRSFVKDVVAGLHARNVRIAP